MQTGGVRQGDEIGPGLRRGPPQELASQGAKPRLPTEPALLHPPPAGDALGDQRQPQVLGPASHAAGVVGGFGSEAVVQMGHYQGQFQPRGQLVEAHQQGQRVGPAGAGDQNPGARGQGARACESPAELLIKGHGAWLLGLFDGFDGRLTCSEEVYWRVAVQGLEPRTRGL